MCLSTVYLLHEDQKEMLIKNVAQVRQKDDQLVFTDLMGISTTITGIIEKIDLMDNYIYVTKNP